jgi:hypothetical protein
VAEQRAHPQRVRRPPVIPVTVKDQRGVGRDALLRHQPREARTVHIVAGHRVVELSVPVELHRARDVTGLIQQHVLVGLGHDQARVVQVPGQPPGRDEHLRAGVVLELRRGVVWQRHGQPHLRSLSASAVAHRDAGYQTHPLAGNMAAALSLPPCSAIASSEHCRRWPPPRPALPHRAVPFRRLPPKAPRQGPEPSAHAAGQQAASSLTALDAFRTAFLREGAISCLITPPSRPDPDPVTRQDRINELHRRVREYVTARVLTGAPATEDDRRAYARDAAELSRLLDRQRQADQDRGLPARPAP